MFEQFAEVARRFFPSPALAFEKRRRAENVGRDVGEPSLPLHRQHVTGICQQMRRCPFVFLPLSVRAKLVLIKAR